jgi:hypothetical protein
VRIDITETKTFSPIAIKRGDLSYRIVYEDTNHKILKDT